jgi:hypothetical protein
MYVHDLYITHIKHYIIYIYANLEGEGYSEYKIRKDPMTQEFYTQDICFAYVKIKGI